MQKKALLMTLFSVVRCLKVILYDEDKLFDELKINASEIKFGTLAWRRADLWTAISKKPIQQFLSWLDGSGLYVYYDTLNNTKFSFVDIVDSLFTTQLQFNFELEWAQALNASLHRFVISRMDEIFPTLHGYIYPSLDKEDIKNFCYELSDLFQSYG